MQLKVGELAKHTGLTVRTLHHYDEIGVLRPSARSDGGYRLYNSTDVARLHGIQALRHLGIGLKEIRSMLSGSGPSMPGIVDKQLEALDREIANATELRARLRLLQSKLSEGTQPAMEDWLASLSLMSTYGKYFTAAELKKIFDNWKLVKDEWPPLLQAVRQAMNRGVPTDSVEIQPLVRDWTDLMVRWMEGDLELMSRWGRMHEREPGARTKEAPDLATIHYMQKAIDTRMAVLCRHFDMTQLVRIGTVDREAWRELSRAVRGLIQRKASIDGRAARTQVKRWRALLDALTLGDVDMQRQMTIAFRDEPLLRPTALLEPPVRDYLMRTHAALETQAA